MRIVFEGRRDFCRVLDKPLLAVVLLEILIQRFAESLAVRYFAFLQTDDCLNRLFREDRIAFDFQIAEAIDLAVDDRDGNLQRVVNR